MIAEEAPSQKETALLALLVLLAAVLASVPVLLPGHFLIGHDGLFHLTRIAGMAESLRAGQFPVRINAAPFAGYGMATDIFYPDIFLYAPAVLQLLGVSPASAWKAFMVMGNLLTAFASWWAYSAVTRSRRTGAIAAALYLAFLYRLIDMYARSAVGEMLAMAFLPAALISIYLTLRRSPSYWPAVVISVTGIFQSHIITGLLVIAAAVLMSMISARSFRDGAVRRAAGKAALFTCLLNLWFYAPLLYFHRHMDYAMKDTLHKGIEGMVRPLASMDFYMGSAMLLLLALCLLFQIFGRGCRMTRAFWWLLAIAAAFLAITAVQLPWRIAGRAASVLQFPFRMAMFAAALIPLAISLVLAEIRRRAVVVLAIAICFCGNFYWLVGASYAPLPAAFKTPLEFLQNPVNRPAPMYTIELAPAEAPVYLDWAQHTQDYLDARVAREMTSGGFLNRKIWDHADGIHPSDRIGNVWREGTSFEIACRDGEAAWVQLPLFWYIGYRAETADGSEVPLERDDSGQIRVLLPPGGETVHVWYAGLPWFRVTDILSCLGLLGFLYILYRQWRISAS